MPQAQWLMKSDIGLLYLVASEKGLQGVFWKKQSVPFIKSLQSTEPVVKMLAQAEREVKEYIAGKRKKFSVPIKPEGTLFQKQVWTVLSKIPYGTTRTYKDIAKQVHSEKAVRAVGTANAKNPLCIVVPCHRVVSSNGSLGGYSGGLRIKQKLLEIGQVGH